VVALPPSLAGVPVEVAGLVGGMLTAKLRDGRQVTLWRCTQCKRWHEESLEGAELVQHGAAVAHA
jgi:hypothetical protein